MTDKIFRMAIVLLAASYLFGSAGTAGGLTSSQLERAGYVCFPAGPNSWIHCLLERKLGKRSIPVKVFSVDGEEFLGTELLLHADIYSGQPCPQDGLDTWDPLALPGYFACHHFDTGHH